MKAPQKIFTQKPAPRLKVISPRKNHPQNKKSRSLQQPSRIDSPKQTCQLPYTCISDNHVPKVARIGNSFQRRIIGCH